MSEEEPVTSPDQLKPGFRKSATVGGVVTILTLVAMALINNKSDGAAVWWLFGIAALIALLLAGDWALRRNGLRS